MASRPRRGAEPPTWLKPGALVDFRSIISGPVTHHCRKVSSEPWRLGSGDWVVSIEDVSGGVAIEALSLAAPAPSAEPHRRPVDRGDFGKAIRFEVEHEDGTVVRYVGPDAQRHLEALDAACDIAWSHGKSDWPTALPEVFTPGEKHHA